MRVKMSRLIQQRKTVLLLDFILKFDIYLVSFLDSYQTVSVDVVLLAKEFKYHDILLS